ncbi:hypothetical protein FOZ63_009140 [Perkinsus olseni]|uniref:Vesicle tethering protein Uso1/P115-like head domain-containing protein n=1 Tax=Perkinsus olseni TaxID=32597 RepID=A0A7J6R456_PEROL|nr:hypothetical protein FOZ63_009140 [Perkinsus olseni]
MDALLRTVDARVSVIDTQLALRDALDVLDRNGTNSPEGYKVFTKLFDTCRSGGPELVTALLADPDVMSSMLQNIVPRLQGIEDSEALQDCLSFLGLLVADSSAKADDDEEKRRRVDRLQNRCAERILNLSKGGSEIVALITKQDSDMYLLYAELRLIQSLHKRFPRVITSAVLEAPEVVAALVDLLKSCPAAFVRNECLSLVHNMVSAAADQAGGRPTVDAAEEQMQIFPMLAFQGKVLLPDSAGVIEALFGIVLEDPVASAGDVPVVALDTNLELLKHEKTRRFWRTGGRESAEWGLEVFRHALYPNHRQRRNSELPDEDLFPEQQQSDEDLKGIPDVGTFRTVWPTLKLSMEILQTYWGSSSSTAKRDEGQSEEKAYCIDLGIVEIIADQIDNYHLSDECRRDLLNILLTLLQSCGAATVERLTTSGSAAVPPLWKIAGLMVQSPPPSVSFRSSVSSFIEKATDLPQAVSSVIQNSLCASFSARVAGMSGTPDDDHYPDTGGVPAVPTPGAWVTSHLEGVAVVAADKDSAAADDLSQAAMHTNAWFSLQLLMNCVKGKNAQAQKMLSSSAVMPSSSGGGYQSLLSYLDKILLNLANSLAPPEHVDDDGEQGNDIAVWTKDPSSVVTTVIAILQTLLVFRVDADADDAISTEPIYLRVLQGLLKYRRAGGRVDINGLASLLLGTCLKPSCANSDLATSIIEEDVGVVETLRMRTSTRRDDEASKLRSLLEVQQREVARSKQEANDTLQVLAGMSEQLSELRDTDTASLLLRVEALQTANAALTDEVEALKEDNENLAKYLIAEREAASRLLAESSYLIKALAGCYRDENLRVQKLIARQQHGASPSPDDRAAAAEETSASRDLINLIVALKKVCPSALDILAAPIDRPISNRLPPNAKQADTAAAVVGDDERGSHSPSAS